MYRRFAKESALQKGAYTRVASARRFQDDNLPLKLAAMFQKIHLIAEHNANNLRM